LKLSGRRVHVCIMSIVEQINKNKIIAIIRGIEQDKIIEVCKALYIGGIRMIEVTFNQSSLTGNQETYEAISAIAKEFGDEVSIGAGTVMTIEQAELATSAGARYMISPNLNKDVVKRCIELGAEPIPGVLTPTEIVSAYNAGAKVVKIFPIARMGGSDYLKDITAPISHIPVIAVGGVEIDTVSDYINAGAIGVGLGSNLVDKTLIKENRFDELATLAESFVKKTCL